MPLACLLWSLHAGGDLVAYGFLFSRDGGESFLATKLGLRKKGALSVFLFFFGLP